MATGSFSSLKNSKKIFLVKDKFGINECVQLVYYYVERIPQINK